MMIAIVIGVVALIAWTLFLLHLRSKQSEPTTRDKVVGFLLFGPFFWLVDSYLKKRKHQFSTRELLSVIFLVIFLFAGPPIISWIIGGF